MSLQLRPLIALIRDLGDRLPANHLEVVIPDELIGDIVDEICLIVESVKKVQDPLSCEYNQG